jgi:hypothetical protein
MGMARAADCRWKIDEDWYSIQRFRRSGRTNPINVSNSEGALGNQDFPDEIGSSAFIPDLPEGQFQLVNATWDESANPFTAPAPLVEGTYHLLQQFPAGVSGSSSSVFNALLIEVTHEGQIPGPQPVTLTFQSDGFYDYPH